MNLLAPYAAVLALLLLALSLRTIQLRQRHRVALGDGGHSALQRAIRAQANFCEYTPLALLLLLMVAALGGTALWIHSLAGSLLLGRLIHAAGISRINERLPARVIGMLLTFTSLLGSSVFLLLFTLSH